MYTVYRIDNIKTGRFYFGYTSNLKKRFSQHKSLIRNGGHGNSFISLDARYYGIHSFTFSEVAGSLTKKEAVALEYNLINGNRLNPKIYNYFIGDTTQRTYRNSDPPPEFIGRRTAHRNTVYDYN